MVKHLPTVWETWVQSLGQEDPLEKEMATHYSTLAWKTPWTEEPGRLQSTGSQRVRHNWATSLHFILILTKINVQRTWINLFEVTRPLWLGLDIDSVMNCLSSLDLFEVKSLSHVQLFATPWTLAYQASTSMGFSRQEYWGGLPFPSPRDIPNPGIEPRSPTL